MCCRRRKSAAIWHRCYRPLAPSLVRRGGTVRPTEPPFRPLSSPASGGKTSARPPLAGESECFVPRLRGTTGGSTCREGRCIKIIDSSVRRGRRGEQCRSPLLTKVTKEGPGEVVAAGDVIAILMSSTRRGNRRPFHACSSLPEPALRLSACRAASSWRTRVIWARVADSRCPSNSATTLVGSVTTVWLAS